MTKLMCVCISRKMKLLGSLLIYAYRYGYRDRLWRENATLSVSRMKVEASMTNFDLDKELQPGFSLHFTSVKTLWG